jgi:hypothetical protein
VSLFSSEVFLVPCVLEMPLFSSEVFLAPCFFRAASFFFRGIFLPLAFLGVPLFALEVYFEPMSEGSDSTPFLMASLFNMKVHIEYGANNVSDFDPKALCIWGTKLLLLLWGT